MARTRYQSNLAGNRLSRLPAAERATSQMAPTGARTRVLVIRLEHVPAMDATGLVAFESALLRLSRNGCQAILCGLQRQPAELLARAKIQETPGKLAIRPDLGAALALAREIVESPSPRRGHSAL